MIFHRKCRNIVNPSISINNVTIESVHTFNFLRITNLIWKDHLNNCSGKPLQAIGIL